jgi:hypothetical protein
MENLTPSISEYNPPNLYRVSLDVVRNQMYLDLIHMGFKVEMINKALFINKDQNLSIEQMVSLLTVENGVWQHNYIEENGLCFICGENSNHLNYSTPERISLRNSLSKRLDSLVKIKSEELFRRKSNSISSLSLKHTNSQVNMEIFQKRPLKENDDKLTENIECPVCMCNVEPEDAHCLSCKHSFCKDCWREFIREEIHSNKDLSNIHCMQSGCDVILDSDIMTSLIFLLFTGETIDELLNKYSYFQLKQEILKSNDKKLCPFTDCKSFGTKIRDENNVLRKFIKCEFDHEFCFDCLVFKENHKSISCEEVIDENFEKWREGKNIKQCPNCALWTEKNEGCNHMTCSSCGFQWCWLCLKVYTTDHYSNPLSECNGRQFWGKFELIFKKYFSSRTTSSKCYYCQS